jgi:hypothetical protein
VCGTIERMLKNKTRKATCNKLYEVIAAPMLMYGSENWDLNRSERRKTETTEMYFLRHVSGCTLADHTHSKLQICALEARLQDYKTSKVK